MIANYGFFLLFLCCLCSGYGTLASLVAGRTAHRQLYLSSRMALSLTTVLVTLAAALFLMSLFNRDYSLAYIAKNSSNDLPPWYTLTAFWSSLEGSHFLWTLFISIFSCIAVWSRSKDNEHIMPWVMATLQSVQTWMFYLLITHSDPFKLMLPAPANGRGMNELLQNPYMGIHPPLLFIGYTATAVPFAYGIAALCFGDINEGWLRTVRRWSLFSWAFLTASIALGGRWAYVELGWAGYWAWDPVENSSFLPWLIMTVLVHTLIVQEKLGQLKRLSIILTMIGFFLTFFGTFITRSGVISSVHAFGEGPIGPNYLLFLAGIAGVSSVLYAVRAPSVLPPDSSRAWGVSRESAIAVNLFLTLAFAAIVFIGTVFPIVSEALTGQRISVHAPYFNAFAPWVGLALVLTLGLGILMQFQSAKMPGAGRVIIIAAVVAFPLSAAFAYWGEIMATPDPKSLWAQLIGTWVSFFAGGCVVGDFFLRFRLMNYKTEVLFKRNLAWFGSMIAHIGFLVSILGFLGNYRGLEKNANLKVGEKADLHGYEFKLTRGVSVTKVDNATLYGVDVSVKKDGKTLGTMRPALSRYPTKDQSFNEIAVMGSFWNDLYVVMVDFDTKTGKSATFKLHVNPTVRIVWISIVIMVAGGLISLLDRRRGHQSRDVVAGVWETGKV